MPLAALRDPALIGTAVARSLDVDEEPGRPIEDTLDERLAGKRSLLLLDNAEHLLPGIASHIGELLSTSGPNVLVTSRERLRLHAEHAYSVPSLTPVTALSSSSPGLGRSTRRSRRRPLWRSCAAVSTTFRSRSSWRRPLLDLHA